MRRISSPSIRPDWAAPCCGGAAGPARNGWLATLRDAIPVDAPWRRVPPNVPEDRLLGGLDLAATLAAGRPIAERGLLANAHGGIVLVPSAERLGGEVAALLAAALDLGEVVAERDGMALRSPAKFAAVLLDEGLGDERVPTSLADRMAFMIEVPPGAAPPKAPDTECVGRARIERARERAPRVVADEAAIEALCATALAFGVPSLRMSIFALRAAKAAAALADRLAVDQEDIALAAALVIAPRATTIPVQDMPEDAREESAEQEPDMAPEPSAPGEEPGDRHESDGDQIDEVQSDEDVSNLTDRLVEATKAAIPHGLLAELAAAASVDRREAPGGLSGAPQPNGKRGRPAGARRGRPGQGARLALVETLRAAAPWQRLRRQALPVAPVPGRILVRSEDFRVMRIKAQREAVTIFVVDASGSAALNRLAEVKGAVELILAECYVRRDQVALIAFRGNGAELILPPTRSLTRAKRALAGQPGGGGTPLATAIEAATLLADTVRRKGQTALVVLMTDGKANIGRSGRPGRAAAEADAADMARAFKASGNAGIVLDIAQRPAEPVRRLASAMGARYVPLPYADAQAVSRAVLAAGSNN